MDADGTREILARIKSFDSMRRAVIAGRGAIEADEYGITLIPGSFCPWEETYFHHESIFDLRARSSQVRFEAVYVDRPIDVFVRPKGGAAMVQAVVDALPRSCRCARCRDCGGRVDPESDDCMECGVGLGKSYRKKALVRIGVGLGTMLLVIVLAWVFGTPDPKANERAVKGVWMLLVMGGVMFGLASVTLGVLGIAIGPRLRLFFLTWYGALLVVVVALVIAGLGIWGAAALFG